MTNNTPTMDRARSQDGWSMIEVVITILVIALVAAYAIPKLLGPRDSANDGTAKTSLRAAMTAAETEYAQTQSYAGLDADRLEALEPSITGADEADGSDFTIGPTANGKLVTTLGTQAAGGVTLCAASKSAAVFCVVLTPNNPTVYRSWPKTTTPTVANLTAGTGTGLVSNTTGF